VIDGRPVLALITARGGSKGLPGKNIRIVGGKPLIAWSIEAARASRFVDRVVLSSDDADIIEVARRYGCDVPFVRAVELASDTATSIDTVLDAIQRLQHEGIVVLLQPTSPLRTAEDIDAALELMVARSAPACVSVREAADHPYWIFAIDGGSRLRPFAPPGVEPPTRRQDLPRAWCLNGAVYAADARWLAHERTFLSEQTVGYTMPLERSADVDTLEDIAHVAVELERRQGNRP